MSRFLLNVGVGTLALAMASFSPVQASHGGHGHSGGHSGHAHGSHGHSGHGYGHAHHSYPSSHGHAHAGYHHHSGYYHRYGHRFSHGYYFVGRNHHHWGSSRYFAEYGCTCYWEPELRCWYYWCAPRNCYYPVSYVTVVPPTSDAPPTPEPEGPEEE